MDNSISNICVCICFLSRASSNEWLFYPYFAVSIIQIWRPINCCFGICDYCFLSYIVSCILYFTKLRIYYAAFQTSEGSQVKDPTRSANWPDKLTENLQWFGGISGNSTIGIPYWHPALKNYLEPWLWPTVYQLFRLKLLFYLSAAIQWAESLKFYLVIKIP